MCKLEIVESRKKRGRKRKEHKTIRARPLEISKCQNGEPHLMTAGEATPEKEGRGKVEHPRKVRGGRGRLGSFKLM